jgi:hypothetical protein
MAGRKCKRAIATAARAAAAARHLERQRLRSGGQKLYACVMHLNSLGLVALLAAFAAAALAGCGSDNRTVAQGPVPQSAAAAPTGSSAPMVVVPKLVGRRQEDAHRIAARSGLKLRWTGFVGKYGNGRYNIGCVKVLSQSPVAGERRPRGAQIAVIEAACRTPNQRPHGVTTGGQPES